MSGPTNRDELERALVRTYNSHSYDDPWSAVEDYQRVQAYAASHPDAGSTAVARALSLPRSRIRPWLDGAMPDPMRALNTCWRRNWLPDDWTSDRATAWAILATGILAGGSITSDYYVPRWVVDDPDERAVVTGAASVLGLTLVEKRQQPLELEPKDDASVCGRLLSILECPQGDKNTHSLTGLPFWATDASESVQRQVARAYVTFRDTDAAEHIQISESRGAAYRRQLGQLFERVVSDPECVSATTWPVRVHDDAAGELTPLPAIAASPQTP